MIEIYHEAFLRTTPVTRISQRPKFNKARLAKMIIAPRQEREKIQKHVNNNKREVHLYVNGAA